MPSNNDFGPGFLSAADDFSKIVFHLRGRQTAQAVIGAQFEAIRFPVYGLLNIRSILAKPPALVSPLMLSLTDCAVAVGASSFFCNKATQPCSTSIP